MPKKEEKEAQKPVEEGDEIDREVLESKSKSAKWAGVVQ
jgi:hypothetical protein